MQNSTQRMPSWHWTRWLKKLEYLATLHLRIDNVFKRSTKCKRFPVVIKSSHVMVYHTLTTVKCGRCRTCILYDQTKRSTQLSPIRHNEQIHCFFFVSSTNKNVLYWNKKTFRLTTLFLFFFKKKNCFICTYNHARRMFVVVLRGLATCKVGLRCSCALASYTHVFESTP